MKLTIFHFGDSHWLTEHMNPALGYMVPTDTQKDFYREYMNAFERFPFHEYREMETDRVVVIHTGDFANFTQTAVKPYLRRNNSTISKSVI